MWKTRCLYIEENSQGAMPSTSMIFMRSVFDVFFHTVLLIGALVSPSHWRAHQELLARARMAMTASEEAAEHRQKEIQEFDIV